MAVTKQEQDKITEIAYRIEPEKAVILHNELDELVHKYGIEHVVFRLGAVAISNYAFLTYESANVLKDYEDGIGQRDAEQWNKIAEALAEVDKVIAHLDDEDLPY